MFYCYKEGKQHLHSVTEGTARYSSSSISSSATYTPNHMHDGSHTHTQICSCVCLIAWTITQRQIPVCRHSSMWHSIYLTAAVSPECYISSVPLSIVFRRGSGSTGLPRCIWISHKAQWRATVTLSDLWQRGASVRLCSSEQVGSMYQLGLL